MQTPIPEMHSQPSPVVTLLQAQPESVHNPEPVASLSKHLNAQQEKERTVEDDHDSQNQVFMHPPQQVNQTMLFDVLNLVIQ